MENTPPHPANGEGRNGTDLTYTPYASQPQGWRTYKRYSPKTKAAKKRKREPSPSPEQALRETAPKAETSAKEKGNAPNSPLAQKSLNGPYACTWIASPPN